MLLAMAFSLLAAESVAIYIAPQVRDGFVDTDKGVADSVRELRGEVAKARTLRNAQNEADAALRLYVVSRDEGPETSDGAVIVPGANINIGGTTIQGASTVVESKTRARRVSTVLVVGDYRRPLIGADKSWGKCARRIIEDLEVWLDANRAQLSTAK